MNPLNKRFELVGEIQGEIIRDVEHNINFLFLPEGASTHHLALKVVNFLNSLPAEDTLLYPYNRK